MNKSLVPCKIFKNREDKKILFIRIHVKVWNCILHSVKFLITALIILLWTPEICLECLSCCNQSQMRSSHHRNHSQATNSFLSTTEEISFVLFKDTSCLVRNLKHRCSPRSALRTTSSTSFELYKPTRRDNDQLSRQRHHMKIIKKLTIAMFLFLVA